MFYEKLVFI